MSPLRCFIAIISTSCPSFKSAGVILIDWKSDELSERNIKSVQLQEMVRSLSGGGEHDAES
jgi:hypothetical protein